MGNGYSILGGFHEGFTPTSGGADPESADNMEIGVRYGNDNSSIEAIYYNTDYANMFGECRAASSGVSLKDAQLEIPSMLEMPPSQDLNSHTIPVGSPLAAI